MFSFSLHPAGHQEEFTEQLARMSQSEAIFLLTTFANIATSRDGKEMDLIEAITIEVYKVWEKNISLSVLVVLYGNVMQGLVQ